MDIAEFVAAEARKPFQWGDTDCVATADRWVRHCTGLSPLTWIGRNYSCEADASSILFGRARFPVLVNRAMRSQGFKKTLSPVSGDVGLIIHNQKMCMGIHAGLFWFAHDSGGVIGAPHGSVWKAWRIQCQ